MKCDFCSGRPVKWSYPAKDFIMDEQGGTVHESVGGWAACDTCHDLIERKMWASLTMRSLTQHPLYEALDDRAQIELWAALRGVHGRFRKNRTGDPIRVEGDIGE